jgi:excisionase family DNA binding protein
MSSSTEAQPVIESDFAQRRDVEFFNVPSVSRKLGCSDATTRQLIASGALGHVRLGRLIRVSSIHLIEFAKTKR